MSGMLLKRPIQGGVDYEIYYQTVNELLALIK